MLPNPDILNEFAHGKFVLSNLAAKRAKQLREGATPLVHTHSNHPLTIALAEIAAGKIKVIMSAAKPDVLYDSVETATLLNEDVPAEFGLLLPALDENEVALVAEVEMGDGENELDAETEAESEESDELSLSDLAGDDEEEFVAESGDEDTLSLSDIADKETAEDEELGDE